MEEKKDGEEERDGEEKGRVLLKIHFFLIMCVFESVGEYVPVKACALGGQRGQVLWN